MPHASYAKFDGVDGSCTQEGREGCVTILSMDHVVEVPVDVKDASATGTRVHGAIELVANVDAATPGLMECVCTSKTVPTVKIDFYQIDEEGKEKLYFYVEMTAVRIVKANLWFPNVDDEPTRPYKHMMTYSLRYDKITWKYTDGNLEFSDEWKKPNA